MIMRLRAKDRERGELVEDGDDMVFGQQKQKKQHIVVSKAKGHNPQASLLSLDVDVPSSHAGDLKQIKPNDNDLLAIIEDKKSQSKQSKSRSKKKQKKIQL